MKSRTIVAPMLGAALALVVATGCSEPAPDSTGAHAAPTTVVAGCSPTQLLECAGESTLADYVPAKKTTATGAPITLGMVNQENTPAASFPELTKATQAAVDWVNDELGGVDGHPIELETCNTKFSAEGSTACGQQFVEAKVPAVLGGIDVFGNSIDVLEANDIPFVGGIPVSNQSAVNKNSFQFSGGTWGSAIAFADYAARTLHAKKVAVIYAEFGSISQSAEFAEKVLKDHGVTAQMIPYPVLATDLSSALEAAAAAEPDAMLVLAADSGCKAGFDGVAALELTAQTFYVGACAAPTILDSVPAAETDGTIVNVEGPVTSTNPDVDTTLYSAVIAKYGDGIDAASAGTVTFRSFMNLYMVLRDLGADDITPAAIMNAFRVKVDAPSFMGHPYTCDGKQLADLTALCSPQQILAKIRDRRLTQLGSWIDVGTIYR
ncbi:MAG TPA: ABC transporter substrate-binding protein [Acidimicrobiales bacterium]|nr:ABC transporter substrate-binding protein [Acidimicrobiales bacterium]